MITKLIKISLLFMVVLAFCRCTTTVAPSATEVYIPFFKNSANECYYLDEFMPVPDGLVKGKLGLLNLRYYTYKCARYKELDSIELVLSFYSQDDRCWSLFEEYHKASLTP